ncbi:MAG TPA: hypothetical protein ENI98_06465 [Gammaproteobacteria bacterium]|nr:hypothetical protein [Gammaproteobacteria bacterium]
MHEVLSSLLTQIIEAAQHQGMDQKTLVARAGLGASTLSKLKRANDVRLSTLVRLANVVGLRLTLSPNNPILEKLFDRNFFNGND